MSDELKQHLETEALRWPSEYVHFMRIAAINAWQAARATPADRLIEQCALICESSNNYDNPMTAQDCADEIRALKSQQDAAIPFRPWYGILDELKTNPKLLADIEQAVAASKQSIARLERERAVTREQLNTPLDASGSIESRSGNGA